MSRVAVISTLVGGCSDSTVPFPDRETWSLHRYVHTSTRDTDGFVMTRSIARLAMHGIVFGLLACSDSTGPIRLSDDWILFTGQSASQPGTPAIYAVLPDGSGLRLVTHGLGQGLYPRWSRDGQAIAYVTISSTDDQVWVMRRDQSNARMVATSSDCGGHYTKLSWSPGGDRIVADCSGSGQVVIDIDSGTSYLLSAAWGRFASNPDWSPTSDRLLYESSPSVHLANLDGTGEVVVLLSGSNPAWSPDGSRIAFAGPSGNGGSAIFIANADGTGNRQLSLPDRFVVDDWPAWSHDGSRIVFAREHGPNQEAWELGVIGANGLGERLITPDTLLATHPDW